MGTLRYDATQPPLSLPDRALEHLHIVLAKKLRETQSFALTIATGVSAPVQVWLDARVPVVITYASGVASTLNERWIAQIESSFTAAGLIFSPEPAEA